ncbi:MAG: glycosyltransferase family 2 protein [Rhodobacteraceae bacterium]|nr:MAG: glycosyltransferase family 2 protein [Paracoccaceae bacterium]
MATALETPAITVILPCRNLEGQIGTAIASLRAQSFPAFEALVIDDGSSDGTRAAAQRAIAGDNRFTLIATPPAGLSVARNIGLDRARGACIAFLDGDDSYAPDFLRTHHRELTAHASPWTACALTLVGAEHVPHSAIHGAPVPQGGPRWLPLWDACDVAGLFPSVWNKLYRRDFIGTTRFRPGALYEDHPFYWHLACRARRIRYLPQLLYHYRQGRAGQITARGDGEAFQHLDRLREVAGTVRATGLTRQREGLSRLATRAVDERLARITDPSLRTAFLQQAHALFVQERWRWRPTPDITPGPAPMLDPQMRLSVIVAGPLTDATRTALQAQTLPLAEVIEGPPDAGLSHATEAASEWVAIVQPGDCPAPDWAARCLYSVRDKADALIVTACRQAGARHGCDSGIAMPGATPLIAADLSGLILRRRAIPCVESLALPPRIAAALLAARMTALGSARIAAQPLMTLVPRPAEPLARLARSLGAQRSLPPDDRARVFAHLAQCQLAAAATRPLRYKIALQAGFARWRAGLPRTRLGPHIGPYLAAALAGLRG